MPDLDVQIRTYLDATSEPLTVDDVLYMPVGDAPVRPITHRTTGRRLWRGWLVAGAAAAVVLVVLGLLPLLLRGGSTEPAGTTIPTPTTTLAPTTTSTPPATSAPPTTAAATGTPSDGATLDAADVDDPNAPPVRFTSIAAPSDGGVAAYLSDAVWFNGRLYALGAGGSLYSTVDGFDWVNEFGADGGEELPPFHTLATDGSTLAAVRVSEHDALGSVPCSQPGDVIQVDTLDNQGVWATSRIELPFTVRSTELGCVTFWLSDAAIGPGGILIAGSISGEVPFESIIANNLGTEVAESLDEVSQEGDTLIVVSDGGARTDRIDLAEQGLADGIAEFADYASALIGSSDGDSMWFGERPIAWWSADGQVWTEVDRSGEAMRDHQIQIVTATESGFVVKSDYEGIGEVVNGITWTAASEPPGDVHRWGDQLVVVGPNGVSSLNDPEETLIPSATVSGHRLYFGEMGVFGGDDGGMGGEFLPQEKLLFSADGTTWEEWIPTEFEQPLSLVGIGDDFVVLSEWGSGTLWIGTVR